MAKPVIESKLIHNLDTLGELREQTVKVDAQIQQLIDESLPPATLKKIHALKAERDSMVEAVNKLESDIKGAVLIRGESLKGATLQAIWAKGRETWDSKGLAGYALTHPEINALKKVGEPSVSIRVVKAGE